MYLRMCWCFMCVLFFLGFNKNNNIDFESVKTSVDNVKDRVYIELV